MARSDDLYAAVRAAVAELQRSSFRSWAPAADIYKTKTGWLVKMELAGVEQGDIEVTRAGNTLRVRGQRRDTLLSEGEQHFSLEISYSDFERTLRMPCDLEKARLGIELRSGMLLIRIDCES